MQTFFSDLKGRKVFTIFSSVKLFTVMESHATSDLAYKIQNSKEDMFV